MLCTLTAIPLAAFGDDTPSPTGPTPEQAELLDVREQVEAINETATSEAPAAIGDTCRSTMDVAGIGSTCVDDDGLLRVVQADGSSHTIHGLDAPPVGEPSYAPGSQAAVNGASVADVNCVDATQQHYALVYARPDSVASRYSTIAPLLRTEAYKVSAFIDGESRSVVPEAGRHLPLRCDGGSEPVVLQATLTGLSSNGATFSDIVDGLRAQGYQFNGDKGSTERYIVYYDAPSSTGAAGTGHVFTSDSSTGSGNQNNKGGLYSVEYRYDQGGGVPHWQVLVHEVMHTMGAVANAAPNTSGGGHCNDGQDVMCYADGGSVSNYRSNACPAMVLDCNRNDYFNPAPASNTYLATHWNAAAAYNSWLIDYTASSTLPGPGTPIGDGGSSDNRTIRDTQRPTAPARIRVRQRPGRVILTWSGGRDNVGVRRFQVRLTMRTANGSRQRIIATTRGRAATLFTGRLHLRAGVRYRLSIVTRDAAGNTSSARSVLVRIAPLHRHR